MKMLVLAIFDVKAEAFMRPIFVASKGVGIRLVADEANRNAPENLLFHHPEDFRLFELGEWDDCSGLWSGLPLPSLIADLTALKS